MTKAKKVLFIAQELTPYVPESAMATLGRKLPQILQEGGCELRIYMPKWGNINERRNQLHEVIRLSGMNIIINDTDYPLIIKVASIPTARLQIYFIDNDDLFRKRQMLADEDGTEYADNAERAVFYARSVLETVKKQHWNPDIVHCHGWMSSIVPFYLKTVYREEPSFVDSKILFSGYEEMPKEAGPELADCIAFRSATKDVLAKTGIDFSQGAAFGQLAATFCDGYIQAQEGAHPELLDYARSKGVATWAFPGEEDVAGSYNAIYDSFVGGE